MEILVPTDFSPSAFNAAKAAAIIARKTGATLYFLHVIDVPFHVDVDILNNTTDLSGGTNLRDKIDSSFDELLAAPFLAGIRTERIVKTDRVFSNVREQVKENGIDLVVIGTHGEGDATDFLTGSNANKIVGGLSVPVLTIKNDPGETGWNELVFASSFYGEVETAFPAMREMVAIFNPRIHLLKVCTRGAFEPTLHAQQVMKNFAKKFGLDNYTVNTWNAESLEAGIREFAAAKKADVIAIATHRFSGLEQFFGGSVADKLAAAVDVPILTMRMKEEPIHYGVIFPGHESR